MSIAALAFYQTKWMVVLFFGLLSYYLLLLIVKFIRNGRRLPPGPRFPSVENFNAKAGRDPSTFLQWRRQWGEISSTRILNFVLINMNSHKIMQEILCRNGEYSNGRFPVAFRHHDFGYEDGVIGAQGDIWKQRKCFILSVFRDFGFTHYEQPIERELEELVAHIDDQKQPFNPLFLINSAVSNVICQLLFGERIARSDMKRFEVIMARVNDFIADENFANNVAIQVLGNIVMLLPGDPFHAKHQYQNFTDLSNFIGEQIERRKPQLDDDQVTCLLDALIVQMRDSSSSSSGLKINERQIRGILVDLLFAGMETTSTTLRWALLLLAKHPEIQERIFKEMADVLDSKIPSYADRSNLVYTQAVLHEVERFVTIVPLSIPHVATDTFEAGGFEIPKNAVLVSNLYAAHHDENIWPDPHNFNPSNFYDETNRCLINCEYLIPWGVGKRSCLGERLAKQELFIFFVGLLQQFKFSEVEQDPLPDVNESIMTVVRSPKPYRVAAERRSPQ